MSPVRVSNQRPNAFEQFGRQTPWDDHDTVIKEICGILEEVEEYTFPEWATEVDVAIEEGRRGDPSHLIRLAREGPRPRNRGRPRMSTAERVRKTSTHRAGALVYLAKLILRDNYPKRTRREIKDCAIEAAAAMTGVNEETIWNYMARSKRHRGRIT